MTRPGLLCTRRRTSAGIGHRSLPVIHVNSAPEPRVTTACANAVNRISLWLASNPASGKRTMRLKFCIDSDPSGASSQSFGEEISHHLPMRSMWMGKIPTTIRSRASSVRIWRPDIFGPKARRITASWSVVTYGSKLPSFGMPISIIVGKNVARRHRHPAPFALTIYSLFLSPIDHEAPKNLRILCLCK
jgi:hypothetical protein